MVPRLMLVVEPHLDTCELYKTMFVPQRYIVEYTDLGACALGAAVTDPPDVIVMELLLRDLDGCVLCELLRAEAATRRIPIVVVTAETRGDRLESARRAGVDVVLTKPARPEVLMAEIERLLGCPRTPPGTAHQHAPRPLSRLPAAS
jgi:CheY-like chemotaxis protein